MNKFDVYTPLAYIRIKDKFDGPILWGEVGGGGGGGGVLYTGRGLIFGEKNTSICNLLHLLLFFLSSV